LDAKFDDTTTLTFNMIGLGTRRWEIKALQIPCFSEQR
jgi:hypothetical protein